MGGWRGDAVEAVRGRCRASGAVCVVGAVPWVGGVKGRGFRGPSVRIAKAERVNGNWSKTWVRPGAVDARAPVGCVGKRVNAERAARLRAMARKRAKAREAAISAAQCDRASLAFELAWEWAEAA